MSSSNMAGEQGRVPSSHGYVTGIDGLRAIAVLSVLIYHIEASLLPGGFVGVDLFFVISGFVVSMATSNIRVGGLGTLLLAFYRRRVVRILPAALTFILIAQLAAVLLIPIIDRLTTPDITAAAATAGMSNIILWMKTGDYFSPGAVLNMFTHTWSLAVEEQFYILFPFFALPIWVSGDRAKRRIGIGAVAILALASLVFAAFATWKNPSFAFYMLPARFWELAAGVLLFVAIGKPGGPDPAKAPGGGLIALLSLLGVALLAAALAFADPDGFPFPHAIPPVLAGVILIYVVSVAPASWLSRALSLPPMRYVGRISYSLYLWHWGIIVLMLWTFGLETPLQKIGTAIASLILADLSCRWIERPVRSSRILARWPDWQVVTVGLLAIAVSGAAIVGLTLARPAISLSHTRDTQIWFGASQADGGRCRAERAKSGFAGTGTRYDFKAVDCAGKEDSRHLYVVGDSHAWAYQRLFGNVARQMGMSSTVYMDTGCSVLPVNQDMGGTKSCSRFVDKGLAAVTAAVKPGDILFLPGLRVERYREYWESTLRAPRTPRAYSAEQLDAETARLSAIIDKGGRVIFEAPKPVYTIAPIRCTDWFNASNPHCRIPNPTRDAERQRRAPALALIAALRTRDPRIEMIDPFDLLCPGQICTPMVGGKPVVTDGDHATGWTNDRVTPLLMGKIGSDGTGR